MRMLALTLVFVGACASRTVPQHPTDGSAAEVLADGGGQPVCRTNGDCLAGEYCHLDSGCITGVRMGACRPRPQACTEELSPVCGCDGKSHDNLCSAHAVGVNVAHAGPCDSSCQGVTCNLINDCCTCMATAFDVRVPPCPAKCKQPACDGLGIQNPVTYCLGGQCLLANTLKACSSDVDCYLVDDCCFCLALPNSVPYPPCPMDCMQGACDASGLNKAVPRCVAGNCRLALP